MSGARTVLASRREREGWSRYQLVKKLDALGRERGLPVPSHDAITKAVTRHERGVSQVTDRMYVELYCAVYNATPYELFGDSEAPRPPTAAVIARRVTSPATGLRQFTSGPNRSLS